MQRKDYSVALNLTGTLTDDPDAVLYENYACGGVGNYNGYCNSEISRLRDHLGWGFARYRKLDDGLGLTDAGADALVDAHTGKNGRHLLEGLPRQSVAQSTGWFDCLLRTECATTVAQDAPRGDHVPTTHAESRECRLMPMRIRPWLIFAPLLAAQAMLALGQTAPAGAQSTVLASGHFDSIPEMGVYFRIYGAHLGAGQHATYAGSNALLYELEGSAAIDIDGTPQDLAAERASFVPAGRVTMIRAAGPEAAVLLVFVLSPVPNQRSPVFDRPAVVRELFRTEEPLQGLHPGPYRFSLSRVSMPPGTPAEPSYHRSGAAVDFILAGVGAVTADGKSEPRQRGEAQFEPAGSAQRWENPGEAPLVLLRAAVSPEGEPAVVPAPPDR